MSDGKLYSGKKGTKKSYPTRRRSNPSSRQPLNRFEVVSNSEGVSVSTIISRQFRRKFSKTIYEELSRDELLNRCLGGYSQNSNESFNTTVWNLSSKSYASGKKDLDIATDIAVCNFNNGLTSIRIMKVFRRSYES